MARVGVLVACLALAACGGESGSGTVSTPAPSPTPTPTPAASYPTFAELTGSQTFRTACAAIDPNAAPPVPTPATDFGNGFELAYNAGSETYLVTGDGQSLSYGPAQRDATAPTTSVSYTRTADGFTQRLTLGRPAIEGVPLDYVRGFSLRVLRQFRPAQYQCVYGVPTLSTDLPVASVPYSRAALIGVIYAATTGNTQQTYSTEASTIALTIDPAASRVTFTLRLIGRLQTQAGAAATTTDLGTFTGTGTINAARTSFAGTLTAPNRDIFQATFGGWVFGPQAREAGIAVSFLATDPTTGVRVSVLGNIVASR